MMLLLLNKEKNAQELCIVHDLAAVVFITSKHKQEKNNHLTLSHLLCLATLDREMDGDESKQ